MAANHQILSNWLKRTTSAKRASRRSTATYAGGEDVVVVVAAFQWNMIVWSVRGEFLPPTPGEQ
jgi:hypothetical protein